VYDVTTTKKTHEPKRVLLLRAGILVDANRDGQFSQEDEGKITEEKPWRIWVNDDDDWFGMTQPTAEAKPIGLLTKLVEASLRNGAQHRRISFPPYSSEHAKTNSAH
jgi:hypothetical protein